MSERSTETTVTFTHPFQFGGLDQPQPAGTYLVVTEEALLDGLSFPAWQRTATLLHVPAIATPSATRQVITINPDDLTAALIADTRPGLAPLTGPAAGDVAPATAAPIAASTADRWRR